MPFSDEPVLAIRHASPALAERLRSELSLEVGCKMLLAYPTANAGTPLLEARKFPLFLAAIEGRHADRTSGGSS